MTHQLTAAHMADRPVETGDAGVILRRDGSFQIFNTHHLVAGTPLTELQKEQGNKLAAIAALLMYPELFAMMQEFTDRERSSVNFGSKH